MVQSNGHNLLHDNDNHGDDGDRGNVSKKSFSFCRFLTILFLPTRSAPSNELWSCRKRCKAGTADRCGSRLGPGGPRHPFPLSVCLSSFVSFCH